MNEPNLPQAPLEQDSRFPTGEWTGFFLQPAIPPGRHGMDLLLTFRAGRIHGEGRDLLGRFQITGRYQVEDGQCWWSKRYVGKHDVAYHGYNEGKGIWGKWEIPPLLHGGFHIWPVGMPDPTIGHLAEGAEVPRWTAVSEEEAVGAGTGADWEPGRAD